MKEISNDIKKVIFSQKTKFSPKAIRENAKDGLYCDAQHHVKLYEDDVIRVLDVVVPRGEDEPFHAHELPCVMYLDKPAQIEYSLPDKVLFTINEDRQPHVSFLDPEGLHKVKNIDKKDFRAFRIEIKYDIQEDHKVRKQLEQVIENHRFGLNIVRTQRLEEEQLMGKRRAYLPAVDCYFRNAAAGDAQGANDTEMRVNKNGVSKL